MPVFNYKGFDSRGKPVNGLKDAENLRALRALLKRDGVFLSEAKEGPARIKTSTRSTTTRGEAAAAVGIGIFDPMAAVRWWKERDTADKMQIAVLTRQLATLIKAGVPLAESLGALVEQIERPGLKHVLAEVRTQVNEGASLADALSRFDRVFEELYVNMVRAGEASGSLEAVLFRLAEFLDAQNRLRGKVISALFYPAAMTVIGALIMGVLMVSVVPKVTVIFQDTGRALPWNTQLLIFVSTVIGSYWWALLIVGVAATVGFQRWRRSPSGRATLDRVVLKLPVFGGIARRVAVTRFAKTLATMLASGVPLLRALDIVKDVLGNTVLMKVIEDAKESIKEGESIAQPLRRSGEFPPIVTHMIAVGERSGQLEQMLENVAQAYELEVELQLGRLTTLLEPVMILVMGGSVFFVVASILFPIMEMNDFVS